MPDARVIAARLGPTRPAGTGAGSRCLIVADPEGPRRALVERALRGLRPPPDLRFPADAQRSLDWAREALDLARRGVIEGCALVDASEHPVAGPRRFGRSLGVARYRRPC